MSAVPSQKAEPVNGPVPNAQHPQGPVPSFVHVLPCTAPPVKYLDLLDGCATGIHVTREDTQDLQVLCGRLTVAIVSKDQSLEEVTPSPCAACNAPIRLSPTSPVLYLENCAHHYHYGCFVGWPAYVQMIICPTCKEASTRALIWPKLFPSKAVKNETFQKQKACFGLNVAPKTILQVNKYYEDPNKFATFDLFVNWKHITVSKRPPPPGSAQNTESSTERPSDSDSECSMRQPTGGHSSDGQRNAKLTEAYLVQVIQRLGLANQPQTFYLGDILPLEENVQFQAEYGPHQPLDDFSKRQKVLFQFRCPFDRLDGSNGARCSQGRDCEFWHGWPDQTQKFIVEQVKIRDFPRYLCMRNSREPYLECIERIRVHSHELVRCLAGFHPTTEDLQNVDAFAHKMTQHIMASVVVPEQSLVCAFCHTTGKSNSVWFHLQNCVHWLHEDCLHLVRRDISNRKLELHCPTCWIASVRTIAWPGPFPSDMAKQTIFSRQLAEFKLAIQTDTKLVIVQAAKKANLFTLDYGGSTLATIDTATAQEGSTIWYN